VRLFLEADTFFALFLCRGPELTRNFESLLETTDAILEEEAFFANRRAFAVERPASLKRRYESASFTKRLARLSGTPSALAVSSTVANRALIFTLIIEIILRASSPD
jgi:hypothetical protein